MFPWFFHGLPHLSVGTPPGAFVKDGVVHRHCAGTAGPIGAVGRDVRLARQGAPDQGFSHAAPSNLRLRAPRARESLLFLVLEDLEKLKCYMTKNIKSSKIDVGLG